MFAGGARLPTAGVNTAAGHLRLREFLQRTRPTEPSIRPARNPSTATRSICAACRLIAETSELASRQQAFERVQRVGFVEGLVPADAMDAREAHCDARFMAGRAVHAVEGDFEHDLRRDLAHRAPAPEGVVAHPLVEAAQFLVG